MVSGKGTPPRIPDDEDDDDQIDMDDVDEVIELEDGVDPGDDDDEEDDDDDWEEREGRFSKATLNRYETVSWRVPWTEEVCGVNGEVFSAGKVVSSDHSLCLESQHRS